MFDRLAYQRNYRRNNNNFHTKMYEKTEQGFLMRAYRNMKSRVEGVQKIKFHLYEGKELLNKEEFYEWSKSNPTFHKLYAEYKNSGFERKFAPSVDRIDPNKGYSINNMEWVTMSENSTRGSISRHNKGKHFD